MAERIVAMQQQKMVMEGALLSTIASAGYLLGFDTVEQCMKDEGMRAFLGHALLHEIMPLIPLQKADVDQLAMEICGEMEKPAIAQPLLTIMQNGVRAWEKQALPLLEKFESREGILPACLCMGLSVLIMYFSGAKKNAQGAFEGLRAGEAYIAEEDEDVLLAFHHRPRGRRRLLRRRLDLQPAIRQGHPGGGGVCSGGFRPQALHRG